ncbi:hypothetical protein N665_0005s0088 [Sinapis alba]|nr:hypothetical protein N665_0005s0088 [Sinapis alba]
MESTPPPPPYHLSNTKSASRLADSKQEEPPCLDLVCLSPKSNHTTPCPSPPPRVSSSPSPSPLRKSKTRLSEIASEEAVVVRKQGKAKGGQKGPLASPKNPRRSRRRSEAVAEKKEAIVVAVIDEPAKPRKRKASVRSKKEKQTSSSHLPSNTTCEDEDASCRSDLNRIGEMMSDLVMWRDVAKSTLWFGFGCLSFLSSCFAKGLNFSLFSVVSNLGLVLLCGSFLSNTLSQRNKEDNKREFHVTEDDVLRLARRFLPAANFLISKTSELFSGEPSMTLKVTPFLLIGAEYGHLITLWRLSAFGFFLSFTLPKLYSCYTHQISQKVERLKTRIGEAWRVCSHKKILAGSAVTAFWNLTSIRTRIFAVFIILVIFRYRRQNQVVQLNPEEVVPVENDKPEETLPQEEQTKQPQEEQALAMVVAETEGSKKL